MGSIGAAQFDVFGEFLNSIDGQLVGTKETRHGINPATGKPNPPVPVATQDDVEKSCAAGKKAFKTWSQTSFEERAKAVNDYADAIIKHKDDFARLLTMENGKPNVFARTEVDNGASWLRAFTKHNLDEETIMEDDSKMTVQRYTPLGLCVGIVPWNFPILLMSGKVGPAVMTGNTIIIKASPFTPYCNLKLGELAQQFFPPGVIQVLSGDDNLGPWYTAHPAPDKISFTGSTVTGKKVMESASKTLKRVTLELGGNDPAIVCKDIDIKATAEKVAQLAFANSGQVCLAIKRIYVHEDVYDQFREAIVDFTKNIKVGEGNEEGVTVGPLQNSMQFEKVKTFFADIEKEKWNVAAGGKNEEKPGYFLTPTIIDKPDEHSRIVTEEPFGPIVPLLSWKDEQDVVDRANNTKMGLGASVWTNDMEEAGRIARKIQAGSVWVNSHMEIDPNAPFGGHKESGIGYEWSVGGMKAYCNVQSLFLKKKV